jgi:4-amino-4-deoxy-L-arabinose transferase-like glycosyltransferase
MPSALPAAAACAAPPTGQGGGRWRVLAALLAFLVLWFGLLGLRGLYFPDEGRYAEIPREMLASGDFVTPRLDGFPYFEKPPLQYWLTAAVFAVAGEHAWTARLVPAVAGLAAVVAVLVTVRRLAGRRAGGMAAAMMAGSVGYFLATQFVTLDMLLTALLTCALCAFLLAQDARATAADHRRWMLVAWALCALAVLTKGLVGLALPMLAIALYVVVSRDVGVLRRLELRRGLLVLLAIAVPWFVLVQLRNPGFAEFFFVREHWQRFTQPLHRRTGPPWYFVPIALVFLAPWLPALAAALARPRTTAPAAPTTFSATRFAWCWAAAIFAFFSVSSSKLPAYIMPALAGVAVAGGIALARDVAAALRITAWSTLALGVLVAAVAWPAADGFKVEMLHESYAESAGWLLLAGVVLVATGLLARRQLQDGRPLRALAVLVLGILAGCQAGVVLAHRIDAYFSSERVVRLATGGARPFRTDLPFYSVDLFDQTVPFYLGRTVILVKEQGEVDSGIAAAPQNYIADLATFAQRWREGGDAYAVMRTATYAWLQKTALPMRFVAGDGRRVIVSRY